MPDQLTKTNSHKRLAKNTLMLYGRTILIMFIGLFTARIILNVLGINNYGIYNIVGGFVSLFSIVSHTLTSTTQRFLNFELGKKDQKHSQKVFGAAMTIHVVLSIILIILFETIGLWFLNTKLNIEHDRMVAANWVFQCSIFTFIFSLLSQPYNATIIAHERMKVFAYISLLDAILKLGIVYMLYLSPIDRLIIYAILLMIEATFIRSIYAHYCKKHFKETKFMFVKDISIYKEITGFASLNFVGVLATVLRSQGVNIILNIFFGVVLNAARGIANQVNHSITKFVEDFMTALRPQITKCCAAGNMKEMQDLCYKGARLSFYLSLIISIPIILKTPYILEIWLKTFPNEAVIFVRLTLVLTLCSVLSKTTITAILASGKIKKMTYLIGSINLLTLPICYFALRMGAPAYSVYVITIIMESVLLFIRLIMLHDLLDFPIMGFIKHVLFYCIIVTLLAVAANLFIYNFFKDTVFQLLLFVVLSVFISLLISYTIGLKHSEKKAILHFIKKRF